MCTKNRAFYKGMIYTCQNDSSQWTYYPYNHFQKLSRHPTLNSVAGNEIEVCVKNGYIYCIYRASVPTISSK